MHRGFVSLTSAYVTPLFLCDRKRPCIGDPEARLCTFWTGMALPEEGPDHACIEVAILGHFGVRPYKRVHPGVGMHRGFVSLTSAYVTPVPK